MPGSSSYNGLFREHWSQHVVQEPRCIFHPTSADDVATCIKVLEHFKVPFAIRSGGHQTAKGASTITNGVLVSLDRLRSISYNTDEEIVRLRPGNRWYAIYKYLQPYGKAVTVGHIGVVGCGGQISGGGTSPFLHRQGFSFANAANFEVSLEVANSFNPMLVIIRLDMRTFPLTGVWEMFLGFTQIGEQSYTQSEVCADRRGHADGSCPEVFKPFFDIGLLHNDAHDRTFPDMAISATLDPPPEFALWFSPHGRMNFAMVTLKLDRAFYSEAIAIFYTTFEPARRVERAQVSVHISALQGKTIEHAKTLGGMCAGWTEEDQTFFNMEMVWAKASDDELMLSLSRQCVEKLTEAAKLRNVYLPFIWMNKAQT
ncbi:Bifunctional solanapyrone synthase [Colletotrichum fructicola]|nr:Bifunctional solanapyrone synthase [Colletotrichum fructicola]KAF4881713.1 Bifunctional solanapyrone synthase [Colletotrichum fructicola]